VKFSSRRFGAKGLEAGVGVGRGKEFGDTGWRGARLGGQNG